MKYTSLRRFIPLYLVTIACNLTAQTVVAPYLGFRSQGQDTARELAGWSSYVNLFDMEKVYGAFSLTPEYTSSFNTKKIAQCLFGDYACSNGCPAVTIPISGSRFPNRSSFDWLADYFYLPTDYSSLLHFTPHIENALVDIDFYLGLDKWVPGLFFRFDTPVTWSRWRLNFTESNINRGVNNHDPGYFNGFQLAPQAGYPIGVGIFRDNLLESATRFFAGDTVITPSTVSFNSSTAISFDALTAAKIDNCNSTKTQLADIHLIFGWNFLNCDAYHAGIGVRLVAPTGSRPDGEHFFEPTVGNGKHWEVGAHLTGHYMFWNNVDETQSLGFYCDANITHMLNGNNKRTFDLKGKPFSRYMLIELITTPTTNGLFGSPAQTLPPVSPTTPFAQFQNELAPLANISTLEVEIAIAVQADIAAQVSYTWKNMVIDIGYNFWARSCEKITSDCPGAWCSFIAFQESAWGLKGDSYIYGFAHNPTSGVDTAIGLSATESNATIVSGTNFAGVNPADTNAINAARRNPNIDNPQFAFGNDSGGTIRRLTATINAAATGGNDVIDQTRTSIQPVILSITDLDFVGTSGLSQKLYVHISYNWFDHPYWTPYLGCGAFAEWGSSGGCKKQRDICNTSCPSNCTTHCLKCSLSQWGVWVKGGVAF